MGFDFDSSPKSGKKVDECLNPPYKPLLRRIESDTIQRLVTVATGTPKPLTLLFERQDIGRNL